MFQKKLLFLSRLFFLGGFLLSFLTIPPFLWSQEYRIVAIVNNEIITNYDVARYLIPLQQQYSRVYKGVVLEEKLAEIEENVLERLIDDKLILHEAQKMEYTADKKQVNEQFDRIAAKFPSQEQFEISLERQGQTSKELKKQIKERLTIQKMTSYFVGRNVEATDELIKKFYDRNIEDYIVEEEYRVRHIFISNKGKEALLLQQTTDKIQAKINKGEDFSALAKEYSEGPNGPAGGDLGFVRKGQLQTELEAVLVDLEVSETSNMIETEKGIHFLKLEAKKEMAIRPLDEVKESITDAIFKKLMSENRKIWLQELREKNFVEIK